MCRDLIDYAKALIYFFIVCDVSEMARGFFLEVADFDGSVAYEPLNKSINKLHHQKEREKVIQTVGVTSYKAN